MSPLPKLPLLLSAFLLVLCAACGGSQLQPEMPDPSILDTPTEDLELPEETTVAPAAEGGDEAATEAETEVEGESDEELTEAED